METILSNILGVYKVWVAWEEGWAGDAPGIQTEGKSRKFYAGDDFPRGHVPSLRLKAFYILLPPLPE